MLALPDQLFSTAFGLVMVWKGITYNITNTMPYPVPVKLRRKYR